MSRNLLISLFLLGLFFSCNPTWSQEESGFNIIHKGEKQILVEYTGDAENVEIPEGVTQIGDDAFSGCDSITSITIPKGVTKIGDNAFSGCTSLASIVFPKGVKNIGDDVFKGCPDLTIHAPKGSKAEEYAEKNGIAFKVSGKKPSSIKQKETQSVAVDEPQDNKAEVQKDSMVQTVVVPDDCLTIEEAYAKVKDGGIITIQPGKYELAETLVVDRNVTFRGSTGKAEDIVVDCPTSNAFKVTGGSPSFQNLTASSSAEASKEAPPFGFYITGGAPKLFGCVITSNNGKGIQIEGKDADPKVEKCIIKNCGGAGVLIWKEARGEFRNCEIYGNETSGIVVQTSGNPTVTGCKIHDGKQGGVFVRENGLGTFNDCEIYGNAYAGINVQTSGNPTVTGCKIHDGKSAGVFVLENGLGAFNDCEIYGNAKSGIGVKTSGNPTVTGCKIHDGKQNGVWVFENGLGAFNDCEIYGNEASGIVVGTSGNPTVTGCKIHDGKQNGVWVFENGLGAFNDCEIYGNEYPGIGVKTSGNPTVTGCKIHDGKDAGVFVNENGLGTFNDCEIYGNAKSGIQVKTSGNPTVTGCKIHDGKDAGVLVHDGGKGTFNNNTLEKNYFEGKLYNWYINNDAGEVKGSGNTPEIPGTQTVVKTENAQPAAGKFHATLNSFQLPQGFRLTSNQKIEADGVVDGNVMDYSNNNNESIAISNSMVYYVNMRVLVLALPQAADESGDPVAKVSVMASKEEDIVIAGKKVGHAIKMPKLDGSGFVYLAALKNEDSKTPYITVFASGNSLQFLTLVENMVQNGNYQ